MAAWLGTAPFQARGPDQAHMGWTFRESTGEPGWRKLSVPGIVDLAKLRDHLARQLPKFALPVLLRLRSPIEVAPTFKPLKELRGTERI
jgi:hypothetical protein